MKQLLQFIQSIPISDFCHFLRAKKNDLASNQLIDSILQYQAKTAGVPYATVTELSDPLEPQLKQFSRDLAVKWQLAQPKPTAADESKEPDLCTLMAEEDRLKITTEWFQVYDLVNTPDIKSLLSKLTALINIYTDCNDGYSANVLTSMFAAITDVYNSKQFALAPYFVGREVLPSFAQAAVLKVYGSLYQPTTCADTNTLLRIDALCRKLQEKVDEFLEDYIFTIVVAIQEKPGVDDVLAMYPDFCKATTLSHRLVTFKDALYDAEKSTTERIAQFRNLFTSYHQQARVIGHVPLDAEISSFKKDIQVLLSGNTLANQSLFFAPLNYLPQWSSAPKSSVPSAKMPS